MRFYFKKLVRDNIVDNCLADPKVLATQWRVLDEVEYRKELVRKITEEANEIPLDASRSDETLEELADLQSAVDALRESAGVSEEQVRSEVGRKAGQKGGFAKKHYIEYVELADDSEWVKKFRAQPHKYAETDNRAPHVELGTYRHTKSGKLYEVLGVALHTESEDYVVSYRPLYESDYELFVRPYGMFMEPVTINGVTAPRFERVSDENKS